MPNKRDFAKLFVKSIVSSTAGSIITKTLLRTIPATERFKIADFAGLAGGWYVSEKLEPKTDEMVDNFFDKREAPKQIEA